MTGIDARPAAVKEAYKRLWDKLAPSEVRPFVAGAQWAVDRLPIKEEIADVLFETTDQSSDDQADAVLALIQEKYELPAPA